MNTEILHTLALEILKSKCDISSSSEKDILTNYSNILTGLKEANKELPKPTIKVLK